MKQAPQSKAGVGSLRRHLLVGLLLLLVAPGALAATLSFSVGLDTDDNAATGCTLATAGGPVPGIEQVARAMVTTFGWRTRASRRPSSMIALARPAVSPVAGRSFSATSRSSRVSHAR